MEYNRPELKMSRKDEQYIRELGARIKEIRISSGHTQVNFAKEVGVSQPTMYRVEAGERLPDVLLLREISKKFKVSLGMLINGEDDPPQKP